MNPFYHGTKSNMLTRFDKIEQPIISSSYAIIIELSAVTRFIGSCNAKTFDDFASNVSL